MPVGRHDRAAARRPADELPLRILDRLPRHAVEAGLPISAVACARSAGAIDADHGVVDRRAVGAELDRAHEDVRRRRRADDEIAIDVFAARLERERPGRADDEIGPPKLPAVGKRRRRRQIRRVAFGLARLDPALDRCDLVRRQSPLAEDRQSRRDPAATAACDVYAFPRTCHRHAWRRRRRRGVETARPRRVDGTACSW